MKLRVLVDNNTLIDRYFLGEPAVSYLIEDEDLRILFDTGYSDVFIRNAHKMNQNLLELNYVVLSHGHMDHTWGLEPLIRLYAEAATGNSTVSQPVLLTHPDTFLSKQMPGFPELGPIVTVNTAAKYFALHLSKEPVWISRKLVFLGEIERRTDFEAQYPLGTICRGTRYEDDLLREDSALAYCSQEGLVIITGCSHAGICNIIEQAKRVCGEERIADIIGGLHLLNPPEKQLQGTLDYLRVIQPRQVHACHCTDLASKIALARAVNIADIGAGSCLTYD